MRKTTIFLLSALLFLLPTLFISAEQKDSNVSKFPTDFPPVETPAWDGNLASDSISWARNWRDDSQRTDGKIQYEYKEGNLRFWTDSGSRQRPKVKHRSQAFTTGQYFWRVYVPAMGMNERVSIGAFLYHDGDHELDFEIGSGRASRRTTYKAKENEVLMYLTSQNYPSHQMIHPLQVEKWYDLSMKLTETADKKYFLEWFVNGNLVDAVKLQYGKEIPFGIHCSLENIDFMGDKASTREHYCLFEKVGYKPENLTSTKTIYQNGIEIYPNPAKNTIHIQSIGNEKIVVKLFNVQGVLLVETTSNSIDISSLPSGTYLINVNGIQTKIIKSK